ncbi:CDP-alcohol phosphatidyltransferase family protein [Thermovibrio ammonificans]|jgi:phosphatidylglycerophosphate synthase|uniref:CDP-alcohol phosphatidyltransferase n=1 Tax=Thermovibrio ammonificans (strain DSM 15698 / JCM 12110 / HB-1) TaxID=648996 RepID=E8T585_THEA1|nr:CDP-alcohol phosphatidyltransferase family protein [Thermovibrio ammonificans]ADU96423.1 CDP-alcohol phosphatidyltransferase [Thermovibrio ammonificans HB-1]
MNITSKRDTLKKLYSPFGWLLAKANVSPNLITLAAVITGTLAAFLYYTGHPVVGAFLLLSSGLFDLCDGYVAVNNKKATKFGAVFDWLADKWVDGFVLGAVALRYASDWVALLAVVATMLHTFIKPVAYAEIGYQERTTGKIKDPLESTGFFGRPETLIVLVVSSLIYPFYHKALTYGIEFIAVMSLLSFVHRLYYLYKRYGDHYEV